MTWKSCPDVVYVECKEQRAHLASLFYTHIRIEHDMSIRSQTAVLLKAYRLCKILIVIRFINWRGCIL